MRGVEYVAELASWMSCEPRRRNVRGCGRREESSALEVAQDRRAGLDAQGRLDRGRRTCQTPPGAASGEPDAARGDFSAQSWPRSHDDDGYLFPPRGGLRKAMSDSYLNGISG